MGTRLPVDSFWEGHDARHQHRHTHLQYVRYSAIQYVTGQ
jgi:hypothetical protein